MTEQHQVEILLVEDNPTDAELTLRAFKARNFANQVFVARDGAEALDFFFGDGSHPLRDIGVVPKVVLLDLKLPSMNGFEILSWVQQHNAFSKTLRVVLTDLNNIANVRKAYALGAHSFLGKPIGQEDLHELITVFPEYWALSRSPAELAEPSLRA